MKEKPTRVNFLKSFSICLSSRVNLFSNNVQQFSPHLMYPSKSTWICTSSLQLSLNCTLICAESSTTDHRNLVADILFLNLNLRHVFEDVICLHFKISKKVMESNLRTVKPVPLGSPKLWPLMTGGRCSEVHLYSKCGLQNSRCCRQLVVIRSWSLA